MADPKEPRTSNQACLRRPRPVDDDNLSPNSRLTVSRNKRNNLKGPGSSLGCVLYLEIRLALSDNQSGLITCSLKCQVSHKASRPALLCGWPSTGTTELNSTPLVGFRPPAQRKK